MWKWNSVDDQSIFESVTFKCIWMLLIDPQSLLPGLAYEKLDAEIGGWE